MFFGRATGYIIGTLSTSLAERIEPMIVLGRHFFENIWKLQNPFFIFGAAKLLKILKIKRISPK